MRWASLDDLLEADHPVRIVWAAVCKLDLSSWLNDIKAVERHVGRDATDPRLLLCEAGQDPHAPKKGDSDAVAQRRSRMETEAAKLTYRLRGQTAEWVNPQCRNR